MPAACLGLGLGGTASAAIARWSLTRHRHELATALASGVLTLVAAAVLAATLMVLQAPIAGYVLGDSAHCLSVCLTAPLLALHAIGGYQAGLLAGFGAFRALARCHLIAGLISVPAVLLGVQVAGVPGALGAMSLPALAAFWLMRLETIKQKARADAPRLEWSELWDARRKVIAAGAPAVLLLGVASPFDWLGLAALSRSTDGLSEVGIYQAANQLGMTLRLVPLAVASALLPELGRKIAEGWNREAWLATSRVLTVTTALSTGCALLLSIASDHVMGIYGAGFSERASVLTPLLIAGAAVAIQVFCERALLATGRLQAAVIAGLARGCVFAIGAPVVSGWGADGLAWLRATVCIGHAAAAALALRMAILHGTPSSNKHPLAAKLNRAA